MTGVSQLRVALLAAVLAGLTYSAASESHPTLILVSFDGWRWDYHTKARVPNLRNVMARGVRAEALVPSYPTETFPNHYTLVTGLYPGHHGVVANSMRDPRTGRRFGMDRRDEVSNPMWWGGEPIWNLIQRAGGHTAPMFWPGSEAPIGGLRPTYWLPYDHRLPNEDRVDRVLQWMDLPPPDRPSFVTLYFSDVDSAGHSYGPESIELAQALERVDAALGRLLRGLEARGLRHQVNLVIASDHGMAETSRQRVIFIDDYLTPEDGDIVDLNPTLGIWPGASRAEDVYRRLATAHPRLNVYRRETTPEHWRYRTHERVAPIVGVADEGWSILRREQVDRLVRYTGSRVGGNHGYDPAAKSMHGLFVAAGPAFRSGEVVPPLENVDLYAVLCRVLGVAPGRHDGDLRRASTLLR